MGCAGPFPTVSLPLGRAAGSVEPVKYAERLAVPMSYWLIAAAFGLTFVIAIGGYFPLPWFVAIGLFGVVGIAGALLAFGWKRVTVGPQGVRVGDSLLEWPYVGSVQVLDPVAWRARIGPQSDARAFMYVRPYVKAGVEITVADPEDPHPYWLVASRRPEELAAAVADQRPAVSD